VQGPHRAEANSGIIRLEPCRQVLLFTFHACQSRLTVTTLSIQTDSVVTVLNQLVDNGFGRVLPCV
jgi:hypothetical protein